MPVSVHKMLMHGSHIIEALCIPIGHTPEEGIEARHKDFLTPANHRGLGVNMDLMHWLLAITDPMATAYYRARFLRKYDKFIPGY